MRNIEYHILFLFEIEEKLFIPVYINLQNNISNKVMIRYIYLKKRFQNKAHLHRLKIIQKI